MKKAPIKKPVTPAPIRETRVSVLFAQRKAENGGKLPLKKFSNQQ